MQTVSSSNFGYLIAYLIPGWLVLQALALSSFGIVDGVSFASSTTIAGLLSSSLAALFWGMVASAIRWLVIDRVHSWTGIKPASWDFDRLSKNLDAYHALVAYQYQYYQFYANSIVAGWIAYLILIASGAKLGWVGHLAFVVVIGVFWGASRDTLSKYYRRLDEILAPKSMR
ncbi:MAG: hypothetical protein AAFN77_18335 [Planctomycetota bacterium]